MSHDLPESAEDLRHNTPYSGPYGELPPEPAVPMNRWDQVAMHPGNGLHFFDNGTTYRNIGDVSPENLQHWKTLDLRVILAHLDSAAKLITTELRDRG